MSHSGVVQIFTPIIAWGVYGYHQASKCEASKYGMTTLGANVDLNCSFSSSFLQWIGSAHRTERGGARPPQFKEIEKA